LREVCQGAFAPTRPAHCSRAGRVGNAYCPNSRHPPRFCSGAAWGEQPYLQEHTRSIGEQIVGTWQLDSIYEEDAGGEEIDQFGVAPTGLFMADRNGNFSFQIVSIDGRRYSAKGQLLGSELINFSALTIRS